jgi:signal transduction histidine kinase
MSAKVTDQEAVQAAVIAERERLAVDLHDTAGQAFSVLALLLRHEAEGLPEDSPMRERLEHCAALADQGKRDIRLVVEGQAFLPARDRDLPTAVTELVDRFKQHRGLAVSLDVNGQAEAVPAALVTVLCRVAAEALINVWRHAQATQAKVEVACNDRKVVLRVRDDGAGLAGNGSSPSGMGTASMQRAVEAVGGRLRIKAAPSGGTVVEASVPYQQQ